MPVHAVVLPATVLLVPGAAGLARPVDRLRRAVRDELVRAAGPDGAWPARWGVLAPATRTAVGRRRPSLGAAGIADRWVPGLDRWPARSVAGRGGVPASVVQLVLGDAVGADAAAEALVVELAADADDASLAGAADALSACDVLLVASGDPRGEGASSCTPAVATVLDRLARAGGWAATTRSVTAAGPHLPGRYDVVTWRGVAPTDQVADAANQPTPASSSQNRTVRPTRTVGT